MHLGFLDVVLSSHSSLVVDSASTFQSQLVQFSLCVTAFLINLVRHRFSVCHSFIQILINIGQKVLIDVIYLHSTSSGQLATLRKAPGWQILFLLFIYLVQQTSKRARVGTKPPWHILVALHSRRCGTSGRSLNEWVLLVEAWHSIEWLIILHWVLLGQNADIILLLLHHTFISSVNQMSFVTCRNTLRQSLPHVLLLRIRLQSCLTISARHASVHYQGL